MKEHPPNIQVECPHCGKKVITASKPEIPCICRDGLNNQLCQRHGAIAESHDDKIAEVRQFLTNMKRDASDAEDPELSDYATAIEQILGAELGDGEPSPEPDDCDWPKQYVVPCPGCGHSMSYLPSDGYAWRCGNKKCRFSESGAAQEVSPPSPVDDQDLEGFIPEEPPCSRPECKAMRGDTRELKAALQRERELRMKIVEFVNDTWLKDRPDIEDDGSGGGAVNPCWQCGLRLMEVVRPGKAQCRLCG